MVPKCSEVSKGIVSYTRTVRQNSFLSLSKDFRNDDIDPTRNRQVRTKTVGQSPEERELRQMRYENDKEENEDYDYYLVEDYDAYEEEEYSYTSRDSRENRRPSYVDEEDDSSGNFWSNPLGGMDLGTKPKEDRNFKRSSEGGRARSRSRKLRERESQRKTFRSGNPPAPIIFRDFYDRLFWYGFDPEETTSAADRTMFGGTKGKFNGLGLLQDINEESLGRRPRRLHSKESRKKEYDSKYDDEFDDYEEDRYDYYDDYDDYEGWDDDEEFEDVPMRTTRRMEKGSNKARARKIPTLPSRDRDEEFIYDAEVANKDEDSAISKSNPWSRGRSRRSTSDRRSRRGPARQRKSVASSWFEDDENPRSGRLSNRKALGKFDDEEEEYPDDQQTSPIINILDKVFQVDPDEVKYQAEDYNKRLGLDKKKRSRDFERNRNGSKPRKGYAYRYANADDKVEHEKFAEAASENSRPSIFKEDNNIIDVEATVQKETSEEQMKKYTEPRQSWEDRAAAYERVPPKGIKAWGPEGEIDGCVDARTYAAQTALVEIENAKKLFDQKENLVTEAEEDLLQLKREASIQKKLLLSEDDKRRSSRVRDRLRVINFDIEDAARNLRRAKAEALAAVDRLESIELRHWALLRQTEADQELEEKGKKQHDDKDNQD